MSKLNIIWYWKMKSSEVTGCQLFEIILTEHKTAMLQLHRISISF
jgi:hypothetical protein